MIKKTTKAIFLNGSYRGEYDWEGDIPLSEGENITVTTIAGEQVAYVMVDKSVALKDEGDNQSVHIQYTFDIA